jgi:hypothetical protein
MEDRIRFTDDSRTGSSFRAIPVFFIHFSVPTLTGMWNAVICICRSSTKQFARIGTIGIRDKVLPTLWALEKGLLHSTKGGEP